MVVRFGVKGIKYLVILTNGGFLSTDELLRFTSIPYRVPGARNLEYVANMLSTTFNLNLQWDYFEVVPEDVVKIYEKEGFLNEAF